MLKRILNATIFAILAPKHAFSTQPNFQSSHDGRCTVSYMVGLIKKSGLWDASKPCFGLFLAYGAHFGPRWYLQLWFLNFCETRANRSDPVICSRIAFLHRKRYILFNPLYRTRTCKNSISGIRTPSANTRAATWSHNKIASRGTFRAARARHIHIYSQICGKEKTCCPIGIQACEIGPGMVL